LPLTFLYLYLSTQEAVFRTEDSILHTRYVYGKDSSAPTKSISLGLVQKGISHLSQLSLTEFKSTSALDVYFKREKDFGYLGATWQKPKVTIFARNKKLIHLINEMAQIEALLFTPITDRDSQFFGTANAVPWCIAIPYLVLNKDRTMIAISNMDAGDDFYIKYDVQNKSFKTKELTSRKEYWTNHYSRIIQKLYEYYYERQFFLPQYGVPMYSTRNLIPRVAINPFDHIEFFEYVKAPPKGEMS